jgi:hypothetical protein
MTCAWPAVCQLAAGAHGARGRMVVICAVPCLGTQRPLYNRLLPAPSSSCTLEFLSLYRILPTRLPGTGSGIRDSRDSKSKNIWPLGQNAVGDMNIGTLDQLKIHIS